MAFEPTWSIGNMITVGITLLGGTAAFYGIVGRLERAMTEMNARQEKAIALIELSVDTLKHTAESMQGLLQKQQDQLSAMTIETEVAKRLRTETRSGTQMS